MVCASIALLLTDVNSTCVALYHDSAVQQLHTEVFAFSLLLHGKVKCHSFSFNSCLNQSPVAHADMIVTGLAAASAGVDKLACYTGGAETRYAHTKCTASCYKCMCSQEVHAN